MITLTYDIGRKIRDSDDDAKTLVGFFIKLSRRVNELNLGHYHFRMDLDDSSSQLSVSDLYAEPETTGAVNYVAEQEGYKHLSTKDGIISSGIQTQHNSTKFTRFEKPYFTRF